MLDNLTLFYLAKSAEKILRKGIDNQLRKVF